MISKIKITRHALNRANERVYEIYKGNKTENEKLKKWLIRVSAEALEDGKFIGEDTYQYKGMRFVIIDNKLITIINIRIEKPTERAPLQIYWAPACWYE